MPRIISVSTLNDFFASAIAVGLFSRIDRQAR